MNQPAAKMPSALLKTKIQCASVHLDTEAIQFRKLAVNRQMHVLNVRRLLYAKLHQLEIKYANAHKGTLAIQNRPDASQLANARTATQTVPTVLDA